MKDASRHPTLLLLLMLVSVTAGAKSAPEVTHGVMAAEVTDGRAIIWSRTDRPATMHVALTPDHGTAVRSIEVFAADDYTGHIELDGLRPETRYKYEVWFSVPGPSQSDQRGKSTRGSFATAPAGVRAATLKLVWTGDFAGQNVCRDAREGFPIARAINAEHADLFIGLGDMIYADQACEPVGRYGNAQVPGDFGPSVELPDFWAHWRYHREDEHFRSLLATTPYFGIWDDHEVINDFGPLADTRDEPPYTPREPLLPTGLEAFLDYTPMPSQQTTPQRLYRSMRWGRHAELFFLDTRQYRDANLAADRADRPKTMLGREQLTWLTAKLAASDATWKIIVSSVPLSIPTGSPENLGRDGWANHDANREPTIDGLPQSGTGFEQELRQIFATLQTTASHAVFITTDVHFAEVFSYAPAAGDSDFRIHEVVVGPANSGIFPNRAFDTTFGTRSLFYFAPDSADAVTSWDEAKRWFNYGVLEIQASGVLFARVKDTSGTTKYELKLSP